MAKHRPQIQLLIPGPSKVDDHYCLFCEFQNESAEEFSQNATLKFGWEAFAGPDSRLPYGFVYQTDGLRYKFPGASEIQIVYPLGSMAHALAKLYILNHLAKRHFPKPGDRSREILKEYTVEFALVGHKLLRIILPDSDNDSGKDTMDRKYRKQWDGVIIRVASFAEPTKASTAKK